MTKNHLLIQIKNSISSALYFDFQLNHHTAKMAGVLTLFVAFVNDDLGEPVLKILAEQGVTIIAMRCAGFDRVDLDAAKSLKSTVVTVPAYSPESIAEHTLGLMLSLNRRIHRAYQRDTSYQISHSGRFNGL